MKAYLIDPYTKTIEVIEGDFEGAGPTPYGYTMGTPVLRPRDEVAA